MDDTDKRLGQNLFSLIIAARRPLKLEELQYAEALADWSDKQCPNPFALSEYAVANCLPHLHELCGNLTSVSGDTVSLAHASVKEYLLRLEAEWGYPDDMEVKYLRVDLDRANDLFFSVCVRYWETKDPDFDAGICPFVQYACENLIFHFNQGEKHAGRLEQMRHFLDSSTYLNWSIYYYAHITFSDTSYKCADDFWDFLTWSEEHEGTIDLHGKVRQALESWQERMRGVLNNDLPSVRLEETPEGPVQIIMTRTILLGGSTQEEMIESLIQHGSVSLKMPHFTLNFLRDVLRAKNLTDPLDLIFQAMLRARVPIPVLLGISDFYKRIGKPEKALEVTRAATQKAGQHSHWEFVARSKLATILMWPLGRISEAEYCHRQLLPQCEDILGRQKTRLSKLAIVHIADYAHILYHQANYDEAEKMIWLAFGYGANIFGKEYKKRLGDMHVLGSTLLKQSKFDEAAEMLSDNLQASKKARRNGHVETLEISTSFGVALFLQGQIDEAETVLSDTVELWRKISGDKNTGMYRATLNLGMVLIHQKKYTDAQKMLELTYHGRCKALGNEHPDTLHALEELEWVKKDAEWRFGSKIILS